MGDDAHAMSDSELLMTSGGTAAAAAQEARILAYRLSSGVGVSLLQPQPQNSHMRQRMPTTLVADNPSTAQLHEVPVAGEDGHGSIFPTTPGDPGSASANIDRSNRRANDLHKQRYDTFFWRALRSLEWWGLIPDKWSQIDCGEKHPRYVVYIERKWRDWWFALSVLSWIASMVWWFEPRWPAAATAVLSDGSIIHNMYAPDTVNVHGMDNVPFAQWLIDHRPYVEPVDIGRDYISADIFDVGARKNVTVEWLSDALHTACGGDADACTCMPAVELGVLTNAVLIDGDVVFNPTIIKESTTRTRVSYGDGIEASMPISVFAKVTTSAGKFKDVTYDMERAFCVVRSVQMITGV